MKKQISKNPIKRKREAKRISNLRKEGRLVNGVEIPKDALPADPNSQNRGQGYAIKFYYKDISYTCAGCGTKGIWTAAQQKKYFEVQKGNIYNVPKWCHECHSRRMLEKGARSLDHI
jgi:hypothetical protein